MGHVKERLFEIVVALLVTSWSVASLLAIPLCHLFVNRRSGCGVSLDDAEWYTTSHKRFNNATASVNWENPVYVADFARLKRRFCLLGMNLLEADLARRMIVATLSGALIGFERRSADRPAGIRTMSLASLGAALFTICSIFAFSNGWMAWDASRVSAAIPSGIGFLGSGIVWKGNSAGRHAVRGLTTAAGVWLSAATGLAAGGGLYFVAIFGSLLSTVVLRYGPRIYGGEDNKRDGEDDEDLIDGEVTSNHEEEQHQVDRSLEEPFLTGLRRSSLRSRYSRATQAVLDAST